MESHESWVKAVATTPDRKRAFSKPWDQMFMYAGSEIKSYLTQKRDSYGMKRPSN